MAEQQTYNYTLEDIQRYLNGGMNSKQMHDMERAALQDPFLADAIDGYAAADMQQAHVDLNNITAALQKDKQQAKVVGMYKSFGWLKIAAVILLITGAGIISLLLLNKTGNEKQLAKHEVVVTPQIDSVKANAAESKPVENSDAKSSELTTGNSAIKKPAYKKETQQNDTITFYMKSSRNHKQEEPAVPIALNRAMMAKQAPAMVSLHFDTATALAGRAQGLSVSDSTLKNTEETSSISSVQSQNKKDNDIKIRGYNTTRDSANKNSNYMAMSELEVTKLESKKAAKNVFSKDSSSTPVGGWQSFQEYVYKKLNKPYDSTATGTASGEMKLEFSIDDEGLPYDVKIINADNYSKANDAIDAIRNGPHWITANKEKKVNITLKY